MIIIKISVNHFYDFHKTFLRGWVVEFNQYQKFDRAPFITLTDLEWIIEKVDGCRNNSTAKVNHGIPSGFPMSTIWPFRSMKNKHDVYRGKNCMKKFCESLREHAMK